MEMKKKKVKKMKKWEVGCKKGGCCVLSTSTCDVAMYISLLYAHAVLLYKLNCVWYAKPI
jgi:hypothetical protein